MTTVPAVNLRILQKKLNEFLHPESNQVPTAYKSRTNIKPTKPTVLL